MIRVQAILEHPTYQENLVKIKAAEENRIFCCHSIIHFLDVARIAMIINIEEEYGLEKELIYATALLHDIGRHVEYFNQTPHEIASSEIAPGILKECNFSQIEIGLIIKAIKDHRTIEIKEEKSLSGVIYRADKASRPCFSCEVAEQCNWKKNKKNITIQY